MPFTACYGDIADSSCSDGELIKKPFLTEKMAGELLLRLYGLETVSTKELPSFCDQNFHVRVTGPGGKEDGGREFVLKLSNTEDSLHQAGCYEEIIAVLNYLQEGELGLYPAPKKNLNGEFLSQQTFFRGPDGAHGVFLVMLLTYIPGKVLSDVSYMSNQLLYNVGRSLGLLNTTLLEYKGPSSQLKARAANNTYCLTSAGKVRQLMYRVSEESRRQLANDVLDRFLPDVLPLAKYMKKGVIHADANRYNILVAPFPKPTNHNENDASPETVESTDSHVVSGIIDFNDMSYECLIYDVAGSLVDMMIGRKDDQSLVAAGHFLAGFTSVVPLSPTEWKSLYVTIAMRFVQLLVASYDEYCQRIDEPDDYIIRMEHAGGWDVLKELWDSPQRKVEALWDSIVKGYINSRI